MGIVSDARHTRDPRALGWDNPEYEERVFGPPGHRLVEEPGALWRAF